MQIDLDDIEFELTLKTLAEKMMVCHMMDKIDEMEEIKKLIYIFISIAEMNDKKNILEKIFQEIPQP